jgi:hypothetical protein
MPLTEMLLTGHMAPATSTNAYITSPIASYVDICVESSAVGSPLIPAHTDVAGREINIYSHFTASQDRISVAETNKDLWDDDFPDGEHNSACGNDAMHGILETIPEEQARSSLSRLERSSIEDMSIRDFASMSSVVEYTRTSGSSSLGSAEVGCMQAALPTKGENMSIVDLEERPPSLQSASWHAHNATDQDFAHWASTNPSEIRSNPCRGALGGFESFLHSMPTLADAQPLTESLSPVALLAAARANKVEGNPPEQVLAQFELLADLYEAAQAYPDAYHIRNLVSRKALERFARDKYSDSQWQI